jgi:hypothetical protein
MSPSPSTSERNSGSVGLSPIEPLHCEIYSPRTAWPLTLAIVEKGPKLPLSCQPTEVRADAAVFFALKLLTQLFHRAARRCHFKGALDRALHVRHVLMSYLA